MEVSNPDKLIFPEAGVTKAGLVGHYQRVSAVMLPEIIGRPLTLQRFPNGVAKGGFMQKNAAPYFPDFIERIVLPKVDGDTAYPAITNEEGLLYLANLGTVTFHIPSFRKDRLDAPDRLVFDLDPPEGALALVRRAAAVLRTQLEDLGLSPLLMASGSKGYHLVLPIRPEHSFDRIAPWAQAVAALAEKEHPDLFTSEFLIKNRAGLVFLDWMRNHWGATTVAPFSLRPRAKASVAAPLAWDELDRIAPDGVTWETVEDRLDIWGQTELIELEPALVVVEALVAKGTVELKTFDRFGRS